MEQPIYFLLLATIIKVVSAKTGLEDFYWQDYHGVIPEHAFKVGQDQNNKPIYIGQVLDDEKLIPGKIFENDQNVYYEFGEHAWASNETVKIFCTKNQEKYEWIPTTIYEVLELRPESLLVNGGYEKNFLTYIGRVRVDGNTEIGKVICEEERCLALYTNRDGSYQEYHEFEILTYDPFGVDNEIQPN